MSGLVKVLFALFFLAAGILAVQGAVYSFHENADRWLYLLVMGLGIGMGVFATVLYRGVRKLDRDQLRGFEVKLNTGETPVLPKKD